MVDTTDRYPSNPGDPGVQLEERLRRIEQELRAIQGKNPLNDAVFSGVLRNTDAAGNTLVEIGPNGLKMYDATGLLRARIGYINGAAGYGMSLWDQAGGLRFEVNDDGYRDPWLAHPWRKVNTPDRESTSSGSFVPLWRSRVEIITHGGVAIAAAWVTDAATTAEVRLAVSGATTSAVSLAAGTSGVQPFKWLHGRTLGTGPFYFEIEARVTGGAGQIHMDEPMGGLEMADPLQCSATGL